MAAPGVNCRSRWNKRDLTMSKKSFDPFEMIYRIARHIQTDGADEGPGASRRFRRRTEVMGLNDQGETITFVERTEAYLDCGHATSYAAPAGRCGRCGGYVCAHCLFACERCGMPLCRAHAHEFEGRVYCLECVRIALKKSLFKKALKFAFRRKAE